MIFKRQVQPQENSPCAQR